MHTPKLKLNLEDLNVDSFRTAAGPGGTGTVNGYSLDTDQDADYLAASVVQKTVLQYTEWYSCGGTCRTCPCYA